MKIVWNFEYGKEGEAVDGNTSILTDSFWIGSKLETQMCKL